MYRGEKGIRAISTLQINPKIKPGLNREGRYEKGEYSLSFPQSSH